MDKLETLKRIFNLLNQIFKSTNLITRNIIVDINFKYTFKQSKERNFSTLKEYNCRYKTKIALKLRLYILL
ncbi:hypothetical protein CDQ70_08835 [Campylobacter hyointestinalis subsp. hyointestinalis]|nr:hypothetical protein CDQ70_08835 [Campylobacter hyointestinalis subsp. hyointestinalis]